MAEFHCPSCHAEIEPDLLKRTGRAECPFCQADLSALGLPEPAPADAIAAGSQATDEGTAAGQITRPIPELPEKSRIKVVESTPDRLVLYIQGGGKQAVGIGCFAIAWNAFMVLFTPMMVGGMLQGGNNGPPLLFIIPFVGVFWAVGLGMGFFWLKMTYERTFLLLDRERLAVQRTLFSRKRIEQVALTADSRAQLVESYQQNEKPVYRVEVNGSDKPAKFGTALSDDEKDWLVDRINEFLGHPTRADDVDDDDDDDEADEETGRSRQEVATAAPALTYPNACEKCGAPLDGSPVEGVLSCAHCGAVHRGTPVGAAAVPVRSLARDDEWDTADTPIDDSVLHVIESSPERLNFWFGVAPGSPVRWAVPLFLVPFSIAWFSFIGFFAWNMVKGPFGFFSIFPLLFLLPFIAAGLFMLALALYAPFGRTTVDLTREKISCRWSIGPAGYARSLPVAAIDSVKVKRSDGSNRRVRGKSASGKQITCVVSAGSKTLPLSFFNDEKLARQIASLVRTKLVEMGQLPPRA